jgi:purine-binding chemotaxis protein CheW
VLGLANVRERTLPILSLAALLGFEGGQGEPPDSRVLVVDHAGTQIGLTVDTVQSILRLPESAIDAVPPVLQRGRGQAELDAIGRPGEGRPLVSILSAGGLFANQFVAATLAAAGGKTGIMDEQGTTGAQEQFVVFELGEERYGLPVASVQEVLRLPNTITRLPNAPRFLSGIINLRGRPVPIIDQRERFDAPSAPGTVQPRVIIVTVGKLQAGLVVDAVTEILSVPTTDLVTTPSLASDRSAIFSRVAKVGDDGRLILLIDAQELLSRAEQDVVADIAARQTVAGTM